MPKLKDVPYGVPFKLPDVDATLTRPRSDSVEGARVKEDATGKTTMMVRSEDGDVAWYPEDTEVTLISER